MDLPTYSLVIPTYERGEALGDTLASIAAQTLPAAAVVVVDGSPTRSAEAIVKRFSDRLPIAYRQSPVPSAARQRNQGAAAVTSPLVGFFDDDMILEAHACEAIVRVFHQDAAGEIGGIAARIRGETHPSPKRLLRAYYRMQAGFDHPTYGGKLFGPAINCYPCYDAAGPDELVAADWLNAGCVFYRTELFLREKFPDFDGYSFMEDVHLSARIAKSHRLYFHAGAQCEHRWGTNPAKHDPALVARMRIRNQRQTAREVLQMSGLAFEARFLAHRAFASLSILRRRQPGWWRELAGTWC